ncbi:MAG: ribosome maturation factor RimM [Bacteroidota bacterium]
MKIDVESLVAIGRIVKPFGIGGEVVVQSMTGTPSRFRQLKSVYIGAGDKAPVTITIERVAIEKRGVRVKFEGIADRTEAEHLVGSLLMVAENDRAKLPRGRFYVHDVVGMRVVDDIRGEIGRVRDVLKYPAHDVYVIDWNGGSYMIPAVKEFVVQFDVPGKTLHVHLIEGMVAENEGEVA